MRQAFLKYRLKESDVVNTCVVRIKEGKGLLDEERLGYSSIVFLVLSDYSPFSFGSTYSIITPKEGKSMIIEDERDITEKFAYLDLELTIKSSYYAENEEKIKYEYT